MTVLHCFTERGLLCFRPSLEALLEEYWDLMPDYQGVKLESLEVLRILFGFFPTYRQVSASCCHMHYKLWF